MNNIKDNWRNMDWLTRIAAILGCILFFPVILIGMIFVATLELFMD